MNDLKNLASSTIVAIARVVGACFCIVGTSFILWTVASEDGRFLHAILGGVAIAIGIMALVTEPPTSELLKRVKSHLEGK